MRKECATFEITISAYLDGESTELEKQGLFLHLAECGDCRSFLESLVSMKVDSARERKAVLSPALDARVHMVSHQTQPGKTVTTREAITSYSFQDHFWRKRISVPSPIGIALILLLVTTSLLSVLNFTGHRTEEPVRIYVSDLPPLDVYPDRQNTNN